MTMLAAVINVFTAVAAVSLISIVVFLVLRKKGRAGQAAMVFVSCAIITGSLGDMDAHQKGFENTSDMQAAQNAGISDPRRWRVVSADMARAAALKKATADAEQQAIAARETQEAARRDAADRAAKDTATRQAVMIITAEQVLRDHLKDPGSADIKTISAGADSFGHTVVCGGVNAKNSFGGYTGMKGFVVTPETGSVEIEGSGNDVQFNMAWTNNCRS